MSVGFLLDENLPRWWHPAISRRQPDLRIWQVGEPGAPLLQSPDPLILEWCEANDSFLITNNRTSMPGHLADHVAQGRQVPGIFNVDPARDVGDVADALALIEGASFPDEHRNQISYLPIT